MKQNKQYKPSIGLLVAIFLFGFLLNVNTFNHGYVLDDPLVINENRITKQGLEGIPTILTSAYRYGFRDDKSDGGLYRPLSVVTFAIEHELFGLNPTASHIIQVLIYAFTGLMLFLTLLKLFKNYNYVIPLLATLFFIAHPIHTEVVANLKSRDEMLSFLCSIISIYFLLDYLKEKKINFLIISLIGFFLGMLSKESTITIFGVIPIIIYFFNDKSFKQSLLISCWFILPIAAAIGLRLMFINVMEGGSTMPIIQNSLLAATSGADRWATAIGMMGKYLWMLVFPHPLIYDYSYNQIPIISWSHYKPILGMATMTLLICFAIWKFRKKGIIGFGIIFFFVTISLASNLFVIIAWTFGERFLYVPSLGYCMILAVILLKILNVNLYKDYVPKNKRTSLIAISAVILMLYSFKTYDRNKAWESNYTLLSADMEYGYNSARIQGHYGIELITKSKDIEDEAQKRALLARAIKHFENSVGIYPDYQDVYNELGSVYQELKEYEKALVNYQKALELDSLYYSVYHNLALVYFKLGNEQKMKWCYLKALEINPDYSKSYINLANYYYMQGNVDSALILTQKAHDLDPKNDKLGANFAIMFNRKGQMLVAEAKQISDKEKKKEIISMAIKFLNKALVVFPQSKTTYNDIGNAYFEIGGYESAIDNYKTALTIEPDYADAYHNLGLVMDAIDNLPEAVQLFKKAMQLDSNYVNAYINLANAQFKNGESDNAIATAIRALKIAPDEPMLYYNLDIMYTRLGDSIQAIEYKALGDQKVAKKSAMNQ